jgi:hypothetical protein
MVANILITSLQRAKKLIILIINKLRKGAQIHYDAILILLICTQTFSVPTVLFYRYQL